MQGFEQLDPVAFAAWLSQLPEDHPMLVAARAGVEVADLRRDRAGALREASHAIAGTLDWRRVADQHVTYDELQRRRSA